MGGVFLVFVSWLITGKEAFRESTTAGDRNDPEACLPSGGFSEISPDGKATRKKEVDTFIQHLLRHPNSDPYLCQLLELINNDMLEPDLRKRIGAEELYQKLQLLAPLASTYIDQN